MTTLAEQIVKGTVFSAGKLGTSELDMLYCYLNKITLPNWARKNFFINAGFWVPEEATEKLFIEQWCKKTLEALKEIDNIVLWNGFREKNIVDTYCTEGARIVLRDLEPYYHAVKWTLSLPDNSKLAVISPFQSTISFQINNLDKIWPAQNIWKKGQEFIPIKSGYGPALGSGWSDEILKDGPFYAVENIVERVKTSGATHAIIGCGCLSLLIMAELKRQGITAIHTGGATQILFGIIGKRWIKHDVISGFINDAWIKPFDSETPDGANKVENGCYW